ncbi:hypothetical protein M885DRAFT_528710 [Pelagophyceae sp. CCMP2097]|nr:hypothetical protein M885DRAFT_528710 [Pelagophyceae sp. CCMP2097]
MSLSVLASPAVRYCGGGWALFVVENAVLSENRSVIIEKVGESNYRAAYGACSTLSLASVAYGYSRHGPGPAVLPLAGASGVFRKGAAFVFQSLGLVACANLAPGVRTPWEMAAGNGCPFDFERDKQLKEGGEDRGLQRVTRHPAFWALGLVGLSVAVRTPYAGTAVAAAGPAAVAFFGGAHMDSRHRRGVGGELTPERDAKTSNIPFLAFLSGQQSFHQLGTEIKHNNSAAAMLASTLWAGLWLIAD